MRSYSRKRIADRRGAMLVLVVLCLPVILGFCVFALNVAWMQLTRTELRTATDASARAGSRILSRRQDPAAARTAAHAAAGRNSVGGTPLLLQDADIQLGSAVADGSGRWTFTARADTDPNLFSVRVLGRRTVGSAGGAVPLLFTGLFDRTTFEPVKSATATQMDRDLVLVLDRSGSMGTATSTGTRWADLEDAVNGFLYALQLTPQTELVGLATYAGEASADLNMSDNYVNVAARVSSIVPSGATAIGEGIAIGRQLVLDPWVQRPYARKTIVVMTDGIHNAGRDPEPEAQAAAAEGTIVHTVTFGDGANISRMQTVASDGGGQHWHAADRDSLIDVFREIANNSPTLLTE